MKIEEDGDLTIVLVELRQLDTANAADFKKELAESIEGRKAVLLDLEGLEFLDSSGLGVILSVLRKVNAKGGWFGLCGAGPAVLSLLELVQMHRIVGIYNDRAEAVRDWAS